MKMMILRLGVFLLFLTAIISCKKDDDPPVNQNPNAPTLLLPVNEAEDLELTVTVSWQAVTDPDGGTVTYDLYFGTTANPGTIVSADQATTQYEVTGLDLNTTYYWKVRAKDEDEGSAMSLIWSFTTGLTGTFTDTRDGTEYGMVKIGDQVWMTENLAYLPFVDPPTSENGIWVNDYNGTDVTAAKETTNYADYGVLYNWQRACVFCPDGWHLPTDDEWKELEIYLGMEPIIADLINFRGTDEGGKLKEEGTIHWIAPNTDATNESGFTALPGGLRMTSMSFAELHLFGIFWSSTEVTFTSAVIRTLGYNQAGINRNEFPKASGVSVRCVKD